MATVGVKGSKGINLFVKYHFTFSLLPFTWRSLYFPFTHVLRATHHLEQHVISQTYENKLCNSMSI